MKLVVKVKGSDTTYVLNKATMTWVRDGRGGLFGNEGKLYSWPETIVPGKVVTLKIRPAGWAMLNSLNFMPSIVFEVGPHDEEMYGIRIPKSKAETQAYIDNYSKTGAVGKDSPSKFVVPNIITSSAVSRFRRDEANVKSIREHAAEMSAKSEEGSVKHPHCDSNVLHAPGKCKFCDLYPNRQKSRIANYINFTGEGVPGLSPCPSVIRRTLDKIEKWPGNRPMTQADGFAGESDPLEFATLPTGAKLRYTDETRQTFRYIPKEKEAIAKEKFAAQMKQASEEAGREIKNERFAKAYGLNTPQPGICTRDECHSGPCNGFPRILKESTCFTQRLVRPVIIVDVSLGRCVTPTVIYVHKNNEVREYSVSSTMNSMNTQAHIIQKLASREPDAVVFVDNHFMKDVLISMGVDARMTSGRFKAVL